MITLITSTLLFPLAFLLLYPWCLYPVILAWITRRQRPACPPPFIADEALPAVAIVLAAFNEAAGIAQRIENLLGLDYPPSRLSIFIGTDGCTDRTAEIARQTAAPAGGRIHLSVFENNRGKTAVLRDLVAQASVHMTGNDTLLVFTDANTSFQSNALRCLVRHFQDPATGGVCGRLVFKGPSGGEEQTYWDLETRLKQQEALLDSCLGANGSIYAIRQHLFWNAIPENTIVDDFVIGMKVREAGYRFRFDAEAVAGEELPGIRDEWCRRVRIGSGDYQAASLCKACLHPRFGAFAWCFWSHKILRWFTPHLLLLIAMSSLAGSVAATSSGHPPTWWVALPSYAAFTGILLLAAAAGGGRLARRLGQRGRLARLLTVADHFVTMQAALFTGFLRYGRGNLSGAWSRTPRVS